MAWSTSNRRAQLPKDWHRRRAIAKREADGQCQWLTNSQRCTSAGTDCDHINRFGGDEPSNLQWLCKQHHQAKTRVEGQAARQANRTRHRPTEKHPGLIN